MQGRVIIDELRAAAEELAAADARLTAHRLPTSRGLGLTDEAVNSELEAMVARAHVRDAPGSATP